MEGLGSSAVLYPVSKLLTSILGLCLFALPVLRLGLLLGFRQLLLNGRFLRLHKLLCGKLLEGRCHNIQIPCFEENKIPWRICSFILLECKVDIVSVGNSLKGLDIVICNLNIGQSPGSDP